MRWPRHGVSITITDNFIGQVIQPYIYCEKSKTPIHSSMLSSQAKKIYFEPFYQTKS